MEHWIGQNWLEMSDAIKRGFADRASASSGAAVAEVCELCFEARLLLHEFSHRINNEFASAIGVIADAARSASDEAKVTLAAVMDQLQNYALVQHALQVPEYSSCIDAAAYLRELCRAISRSKLESKGIELRLVVRSFGMNSERCWLLGLIVSELITNAERHAFSISGGLISVELLPLLSFVECRVTDNGVGKANTYPGRGLKILEALAKNLGGTIDQRFGPLGATAVLIFPTEIDSTERSGVPLSDPDN